MVPSAAGEPPSESTTGGIQPPLFSRIQIQTVSWCNRECSFCPSGKFEVSKDYMAVEVFDLIVGGLGRMGYSGRISPYLMNEPLLDKRLGLLIGKARSACPASWIALNTNGDALTIPLAELLFDQGANCIELNAYDGREQHETFLALGRELEAKRPSIRVEEGLGIHPSFIRETGWDRAERILYCRDMSRWEQGFAGVAERPKAMTNRAGNVPGAVAVPMPLELDCGRPFEQLFVNFHGQAVLCCQDWRFQVVVGDVRSQSLEEIWWGEPLRRYREHLWRAERDLPLCSSCDFRPFENWRAMLYAEADTPSRSARGSS